MVLITTGAWFIAPDGIEYKSVYGRLIAIHEAGKELGFIPNRSHENWFIEIGDMIVMGCQVMYFVSCPAPPPKGKVKSWNAKTDGDGIFEYEKPSQIYFCA